MKRVLSSRTVLIGIVAASLATACGDDPAGPVIEGTGEFRGTWDGARWLGRGYAVLDGDALVLLGHRPDAHVYYDEYVRLELAYDGDGSYALPASGAARLEKIVGGDAGYMRDASGSLTITREGDRVSGSLSLLAEGPDGETWRFTRGRFSVPLYGSFAEVPYLGRR